MLPFENRLRLVQSRINGIYGPDNYYVTYSAVELSYWRHCAKWLYELGEKSKMLAEDYNEEEFHILDVGAGYGTLSCYAREVYPEEAIIWPWDVQRLLGEEVEKEYRLQPEIIADIELEEYTLTRLPKMDLIIFTEVMEHLFYNPLPTLKRLKNQLKPGGKILLSTPDASEWGRVTDFHESIWDMPFPGDISKPDFNSIDRHIYQYSEGEVANLLKEANLKVVDFYYAINSAWGRHLNYLLE